MLFWIYVHTHTKDYEDFALTVCRHHMLPFFVAVYGKCLGLKTLAYVNDYVVHVSFHAASIFMLRKNYKEYDAFAQTFKVSYKAIKRFSSQLQFC